MEGVGTLAGGGDAAGARYFVAAGPFEAVAWCEPRDRGAGRYRVDIGAFRTAAEACAACERDAQRRLR